MAAMLECVIDVGEDPERVMPVPPTIPRTVLASLSPPAYSNKEEFAREILCEQKH